MKSGWVTKKLGEVCEINLGRTPPRDNPNYWDKSKNSGCVWVSISDMTKVTGGQITDSKEYITRQAIESLGVPVVKRGTLLLSFKLTIGRTAITSRDLYTNEAIAALPVRDEYISLIDLRYLSLYFESFDWNDYAAKDEKMLGKTLNKKKLAVLPIVIPPLSEQKRIVAKIDAAFEKIDRLKANAERNLANAKELFQSALDEAMRPKKGWVEKRLGEVAAIRVGPFGSSLHKSDYVTDGVPLVNPCHMKDSRIAANIATKVSEEKAESLKDYRLKAGDIVFARRGEIGRLAFVSEKEDGFLCGTGSLFARFKERYEVRFLYFLFSSNSFVGRLEQLSTGTTMKSINSSALESMSFSAPTIVEQKRLASEMELLSSKLESLQQNYAQQIADCVEMRQAILREAFEGNI